MVSKKKSRKKKKVSLDKKLKTNPWVLSTFILGIIAIIFIVITFVGPAENVSEQSVEQNVIDYLSSLADTYSIKYFYLYSSRPSC